MYETDSTTIDPHRVFELTSLPPASAEMLAMPVRTAADPGAKMKRTGMTETAEGRPVRSSLSMAVEVAAKAAMPFCITPGSTHVVAVHWNWR